VAELYVVRHGQASFGAANYDKLSELGWQQARWLGQWFNQQGLQFDRLVTGTLVRHNETLAGILQGMRLAADGSAFGEPNNASTTATTSATAVATTGATTTATVASITQEITGLNEYDSSVMLKARLGEFSEQDLSKDRRFYFRELREALYEWSEAQLQPPNYQSFAQFRAGVVDGLKQACAPGAQRVLLVSSGGPISNMVGHVLQTPNRVTVDLNLQTRNASITQFAFNERSLNLMSFNNVPHLLQADRAHAITYS
jgi:broad specificity phosphatase PhoE